MSLVIIILILAVAYLAIELWKAKAALKDLESSVDDLEDFERTLVGVAGQKHDTFLSNIEAYLKLKNRHQHENIYRFVFDKEKHDTVDWDALRERQKQETSKLYEKLVQDSGTPEEVSFPRKEA